MEEKKESTYFSGTVVRRLWDLWARQRFTSILYFLSTLALQLCPSACYSHDSGKFSPSYDCSPLPSSASVYFLKGHIIQALCWGNLLSGRSFLGQDSFFDSPMQTFLPWILHLVPSNHVPFTCQWWRQQLLPTHQQLPFPSALTSPPRNPSDLSSVYQTLVCHAYHISKGHIPPCQEVLTKLSPYT